MVKQGTSCRFGPYASLAIAVSNAGQTLRDTVLLACLISRSNQSDVQFYNRAARLTY